MYFDLKYESILNFFVIIEELLTSDYKYTCQVFLKLFFSVHFLEACMDKSYREKLCVKQLHHKNSGNF